MLLPWYQETGNALVNNRLAPIDNSKNAFQVYSFVEAAVFVVSAGVLALLYARGHQRAFHLPGGDGAVIMAAGFWVMFLVFYRQLDKPDGRHEGPIEHLDRRRVGHLRRVPARRAARLRGLPHPPVPRARAGPGRHAPAPGAGARAPRSLLVGSTRTTTSRRRRTAPRTERTTVAQPPRPRRTSGEGTGRRRRSRRRRAGRVPPAAAQALTARDSPQVFARGCVQASTRGRLHLRPARRALPRASGTNG